MKNRSVDLRKVSNDRNNCSEARLSIDQWVAVIRIYEEGMNQVQYFWQYEIVNQVSEQDTVSETSSWPRNS
jgi:hypothetical protein